MARCCAVADAAHPAPAYRDGGRRDDPGLKQGGECLCLAVAETMLIIGGLRGEAHRIEGHERGHDIKAGIGERA